MPSRNAAERCVNKWKQNRAVATRYDKRDYVFNGTLTVVMRGCQLKVRR